MSLFAIGDLHLSFGEGVDKPMDIYGGVWIEHAETVRKHWLASVQPDDVVLILGDISWAMHLRDAKADLLWIAELPGQKVLIKGNHDLWWSSLTKMRGIHETLFFLQNDCFETETFIIAGSRGWLCPGSRDFDESRDRKIYEREKIRLGLSLDRAKQAKRAAEERGIQKSLIGVMHFPPMNEKKQPSGFSDAFEEAGVSRVLYGHLHGESAFANGPAGAHRGIEYTLCSLDKLQGKPLEILE